MGFQINKMESCGLNMTLGGIKGTAAKLGKCDPRAHKGCPHSSGGTEL